MYLYCVHLSCHVLYNFARYFQQNVVSFCQVSRTYRDVVRETSWKEPLGRPRRRWEYNIKMGLQEVGWGSMDWIGVA
jgi:hypothetical protein